MEPVIVNANHVMIDERQARKMERRKTALTVSTASTSTSSSHSSFGSPTIRVHALGRNSSSDSLLRELAQRVAEEMADDYREKALDVDLDAIIEAVRSTLEKDIQLASLSGCDADSFAPSDEVFDCIDVSEDPSTFSDISTKTGGRPKVDPEIYSPNFWGGSDLNDEYLDTCTKTTDGSYRSSDFEQGTFASVSSLQDFIKRHNELPSSESEEESTDEDDNVSVISDISGLTDCFHEARGSPRIKKKLQLPSTPSTSNLSAEKSLVGSIVGSTVSKTASKSSSSKKTSDRRVSFSSVHIRHYERIMTDNPASTQGPSVGIGWKYVQRRPKTVDDHQESCLRRGPSQLVLSRPAREAMIRKLGYSESEIAGMIRLLNKLRAQRRQTVNNLSVSKVEETVEAAKRMVKQVLFLKKGDRLDKVHEGLLEI